jgi:hypothetical protein
VEKSRNFSVTSRGTYSYHYALNGLNVYFVTAFLCIEKCHNKHRLKCLLSAIDMTTSLVQFYGLGFHRFNWKLHCLMWLWTWSFGPGSFKPLKDELHQNCMKIVCMYVNIHFRTHNKHCSIHGEDRSVNIIHVSRSRTGISTRCPVNKKQECCPIHRDILWRKLEVNDKFRAPAILPESKEPSGRLGGFVGPRTLLDVVEKIKPLPCQEQNWAL